MSVSNRDIEEAKRRVREMQNRANSFASSDFSNKNNNAGMKKETKDLSKARLKSRRRQNVMRTKTKSTRTKHL